MSVNGSKGVTTRGGAHLFQNRASMDVPILDPWRVSVWIRELGVGSSAVVRRDGNALGD